MTKLLLVLITAAITVAVTVPITLALTPDKVTCFEDQVVVWSLDRNDHSVCLDIDDPFTQAHLRDLQEVTR